MEQPVNATPLPNAFACTFSGCTKSFRKKSKLERHVLAHSDDRSFVCKTCSKSFKRKDHLKRHELSHAIDGKKFHCPHIDCSSVGFVDNYHLRRHVEQVHNSPIKCDMCSIRFEKKWLLAKHKHFFHKESAPYQCDRCQRPFFTASRYQGHVAACSKEGEVRLSQKRRKPEETKKDKVVYKLSLIHICRCRRAI
eukprot:TRINITY_DN11585_c0_g1_i2.p1 TRINITY_DN11585_c0_g1~~TRINITY_DN11585_c0_g1_i2.p1  ORF type:complete len:194 (-),score=24.95 TRINITY_DN11585_c0_g1_i2:64-645(-)